LTIFVLLVSLAVAFAFYTKIALGGGNYGRVGWDVVSLLVAMFGHHWQVVLVGITLAVFGLGFALGSQILNRRLTGGR
jgi:hypothetical protein